MSRNDRMRTNLRTHGNQPFKIVVLHGGPGASGEMAPVARELSSIGGVLEPPLLAPSVAGQVRELHAILADNAALPVILLGHSWGAMLGFIFAARYPALVGKLILVGSGVYEEKYAVNILKTRLNRLPDQARAEANSLMTYLEDTNVPDKDKLMTRLGQLMGRADAYDPLPDANTAPECRYDVYRQVWQEAVRLRSSGKLLAMGKQIRCPVVAIHGDYDPHPAAGIKEPLSRILKDYRFILLQNCGHYPWLERAARGEFYRFLKQEIQP